MFIELIHLKAQPETIPLLRRRIQGEYLPAMRRVSGFVSAHLMAHVDHQDEVQLLIYWESELLMQFARHSGKVADLPNIPGLYIHQQTHFVATA